MWCGCDMGLAIVLLEPFHTPQTLWIVEMHLDATKVLKPNHISFWALTLAFVSGTNIHLA